MTESQGRWTKSQSTSISKCSLREIPSVAEGGGFEPPVREPVRQFSKLLVSATHPSFLKDPGVRNLGVISLIAGAKVQHIFEPCKFFKDFFCFSLNFPFSGAEYGTRTRDPRLGKPMLYQLSHYREKERVRRIAESYCLKRADSRTRTGDPRITNALLYQLSHIGNFKERFLF